MSEMIVAQDRLGLYIARQDIIHPLLSLVINSAPAANLSIEMDEWLLECCLYFTIFIYHRDLYYPRVGMNRNKMVVTYALPLVVAGISNTTIREARRCASHHRPEYHHVAGGYEAMKIRSIDPPFAKSRPISSF
jgi:hypothetical protein